MKKYIEINVGDKEELKHVITKGDIDKFVELTGDDNRLHVDPQFARNTIFKKPVVHGMLGASFISTIIGTKLPGDGALWFSQTLEFVLPVRVGDELLIIAEVQKKYDRESIIEIKTDIFNQYKQVVTKGIAKVKIIERKSEEESQKVLEIEIPKTALVIGGTGGIGKAACVQLAKDGYNVIVHFNNNKSLAEEIKATIENLNQKALTVQANILDQQQIQSMVNKCVRVFGKIDIVVNCSAMKIPNIKFQNLHWDDFLKQIELNIKTTFLILKEIIPMMIENNYGKVINIGSLAAEKPNSEWTHYITAKSALIGFTKSMAMELGPKGIRVNMVSPSLVETELTDNIPEKVKLLTAAQTPLRTLALASDVAGAISFLASHKSDFCNGENIRLNGGQLMV